MLDITIETEIKNLINSKVASDCEEGLKNQLAAAEEFEKEVEPLRDAIFTLENELDKAGKLSFLSKIKTKIKLKQCQKKLEQLKQKYSDIVLRSAASQMWKMMVEIYWKCSKYSNAKIKKYIYVDEFKTWQKDFVKQCKKVCNNLNKKNSQVYLHAVDLATNIFKDKDFLKNEGIFCVGDDQILNESNPYQIKTEQNTEIEPAAEALDYFVKDNINSLENVNKKDSSFSIAKWETKVLLSKIR